jgi:hypothetical protein
MALSMFDQLLMQLACKCSKRPAVTIGYFDIISTFICPICGTVTDTREEPHRSLLSELRYLATELDTQTRGSGEVVERIK